ncbi:hypothetical protein P3L10_016435 [Capsicum annuum]
MDPTLYNAAMRGNIGDANFLLADHLKRDEENGYQVTPKGNTGPPCLSPLWPLPFRERSP